MPSVAELCAGYGGLYLSAVAAGWPVRLAWYAEVDPSASAVMATRHPGTPNLGDVTATDFAAAPRVDMLAAGYPCQPYSSAGRRRGSDDERDLWPDIARAIRDLAPSIVYLENVAAHLNRGFGRVVADLATLGYVGSWGCLRASDVGTPHQRDRLFILAHSADANSERLRSQSLPQPTRPAAAIVENGRPQTLMSTPTIAAARGAGRDSRSGKGLCEDAVRLSGAMLPTPAASNHTTASAPNALSRAARGRQINLEDAVALLPTPRSSDADKAGPNQRGSTGAPALAAIAVSLPLDVGRDLCRWAEYRPAIVRWETLHGVSVPEPTIAPGRRGAHRRLSAMFVEWMMGLPPGWVTDVLPNRQALRVLGNGLVPAQGAEALRRLSAVADG